ncbi:MAG: M1 family metallopeptidase, partial [Planctomycetota bacterium]
MSAESSFESFGLSHIHCGHMQGAAPKSGKPFALPGTPTRWSRDRVVDVQHIKLEVALDFRNKAISGTATHTVKPILDGLTSIDFDCVELEVSKVRAKGQRGVKFTQTDDILTVTFARGLPAGRSVDIAITYKGTPRRGLYYCGPDEHYPDKAVEAWTQGQDEDSRHWYPCYDYPNQKATTEVIATAPEHMTVLSNGRLVKKRVNKARKTKTWYWKQAIPHVTYLVTLVAGVYEEWKSSWRGVPMTVFAPPGRLADAKRACAKTGRMMTFFSKQIGERYPYEKYDQVFVQDFIFGGMENTTATTLTDTALLDKKSFVDVKMDSLVAHELAHQWWGDLVTCRDWSHGWLNEGFAT